MKSVYVFGPIHLFGESYIDFYKQVGELCKKYFTEVVSTYPDFWETNETPKEFYKRTYDTITKLDLFIGEVTSPSWGVGMEFQMAQEHKIPCIAVYQEGNEPSRMIAGIPCVKNLLSYKNLNDLLRKLEPELRQFS